MPAFYTKFLNLKLLLEHANRYIIDFYSLLSCQYLLCEMLQFVKSPPRLARFFFMFIILLDQ